MCVDVLEVVGVGKVVLIVMCIENDKIMGKVIDFICEDFLELLIFCWVIDWVYVLDLIKCGVDF